MVVQPRSPKVAMSAGIVRVDILEMQGRVAILDERAS